MSQKLTFAAIFLAVLFQFKSQAQESRFFVPKEIKQAYEKGTRSYDGKPGPNYWQNFVDYKIKVEVIPTEKLVVGEEKVKFKNNSPKTMNAIVLRLYANVFKKGSGRAYGIDKRDLHDGVELSDLKINGNEMDAKDEKNVRYRGTNVYITLPEPLDAGSELTFETKWKQKLQYSNIRTGICDSTSFFVAYWYPQVSVYDDLYGWDRMNYTLQAECYNNLGNYDVEITAPKEYLVWATGTFQNAEKVLPNEIFKRFEKAKTSTKNIQVLTNEDYDKGFKVRENKWHYTAKEVSDFAFALSDRCYWDAAMQEVAGRKVLINSVFPKEKANDCKTLTEDQQKTMEYFSNGVPGVPYPYETFTTFVAPGEGGGGMEFPMMANNDGGWRGLTVHEMFHTYFPMYVRTNEKRWSWMDEGWADYNTSITEEWYFENNKDITAVFSQNMQGMEHNHGTSEDFPLMTTSNILDDSYYYSSYGLPSFIYTILHHHLGNDLFFKCYKEYITRWAKKSPSPYDFFYTFENVSGQDLSWLWKPYFFEFGAIDLKIESVKDGKLIIKKAGAKPVPVFVEIQYQNGEEKRITQSAKVWIEKESVEIEIPDYKNLKSILINKSIVDATRSDNFYPSLKELTGQANISDEILGDYKTSEFKPNINIVKEDGLFYLYISDYGVEELIYPTENMKFSSPDGSKKVDFEIDKDGKCTGFEMVWGRWKFSANKLN
ncbi:MAG: M1 family metallopeptidase [Chloroflexia bacterium]|nr:M1 family metallopeptidase [Chloroflexia bacterium]